MKYIPNWLAIAADLRRCIYASFSEKGLEDVNAKKFLSHALLILNNLKTSIDQKAFLKINDQLKKAQDFNLDIKKRRENLLMAALLCQTSVFSTHASAK